MSGIARKEDSKMTEINGLLISSVDEENEVSMATIGELTLWMNADQLEEIITDLQTKLKEMKDNK